MLDEIPHLEKRLLRAASSKPAQARDRMLLLGRKTAREGVVSLLLTLSHRAADREADACPVHQPMRRSDIMHYLGLTTEIV